MSGKKASSPDKVKKKLEKVSDHLKVQNETLKKMLENLSVRSKVNADKKNKESQ